MDSEPKPERGVARTSGPTGRLASGRWMVLGVAAALLTVWALYFFLAPFKQAYYGSELQIECDSVAQAGWPQKRIGDDARSRSYSFRVTKGEPPEPGQGPAGFWTVQDRLENDCTQQRVTRTALMPLLLALAAALGYAAIRARTDPNPGTGERRARQDSNLRPTD